MPFQGGWQIFDTHTIILSCTFSLRKWFHQWLQGFICIAQRQLRSELPISSEHCTWIPTYSATTCYTELTLASSHSLNETPQKKRKKPWAIHLTVPLWQVQHCYLNESLLALLRKRSGSTDILVDRLHFFMALTGSAEIWNTASWIIWNIFMSCYEMHIHFCFIFKENKMKIAAIAESISSQSSWLSFCFYFISGTKISR